MTPSMSPPSLATLAPHAPATRRRRKEDRPLELLQAALDVFVEKGFGSARAEDVAARAGVSKGTLYLYYPSKEALLKAVIKHYFSASVKLGAVVLATHPGQVGPRMRQLLADSWTQLLNSPASSVVKIIFTDARNFPDIADFYEREVIQPIHAMVGQMIERGIEQHEFRPVHVSDAVHSLLMPFVMLCLHKHSVGACSCVISEQDARRFIANHLDIVFSGLELRAEPRHPNAPVLPPKTLPPALARRSKGVCK